MATRGKDLGARSGWLRVVIIVVLMLGLTSLIVSALVSGHRFAPQRSSDSFNTSQDQLATSGFITSVTGVSPSEVGIKTGSVQTNSTVAHQSASTTKSSTVTQSKGKSQTVKAQAKSATKATTAKSSVKKAQTTGKKQAKPSSKSSTSSDELFPELRKH